MNSEINYSEIFFKYGLAVFPILLLTGPLISELYLILAVIFSYFCIIKEKNYKFFNNRYFIFFGIFYFSTLFSTIINFYDFDKSIAGIFYLRIPLFAFSIWFILEKFNFFDKKIFLVYFAFFLIIIFDSLLQFYSGTNLLGFQITSGRISSFFNDELILGGFLLRILPIFLIFLVMGETLSNQKLNIFFIIFIALVCFVIYLSGERSSFYLLFLFFFTLFFISSDLRKFISYIMIIFLIILTISSNLKNPNNIDPTNRIFKKTFNQLVGNDADYLQLKTKKIKGKFYLFSYDHQNHYILSYNIFKDHVLFGSGVKGFRYLCRNKIYILENNNGCSTHPHNTYVQIMVSNGLVGLSLIFFALFFIIKEMFSCRKRLNSQDKFNKYEVSKAIIISAIFMNIWPLVPSGNFYNNWLSMLYFYPIGFYLYFKYRNEKKIS